MSDEGTTPEDEGDDEEVELPANAVGPLGQTVTDDGEIIVATADGEEIEEGLNLGNPVPPGEEPVEPEPV